MEDATLTIVTMTWEAVGDDLFSELARYVVVSRSEPGCRNIDLCASITTGGRVVIIEKWEDAAAQKAHAEGPALLALAAAARDLGAGRPLLELLEGLSAYDLS